MSAEIEVADKAIATLRARLALASGSGYVLNISERNGRPVFIVCRWDVFKELDSLAEVETFAREVGA